MKEFSKKIVFALCVLWVVTAVFGIIVVAVEPSGLESLFNFIGLPFASAVVGYLCKSAFENREKIRKEETYAETDFTDKQM